MGVRGLHTFINKLPGSSRIVKIPDEVRNYRRVHGCDPIIIIDLWTMANNLKQSTRDIVIGYRLNVIRRRFEEFLSKLKAAGADLIFVFKKTRVHSSSFEEEMEEDYGAGQSLVETLRAGGDLDYVERYFEYKLHQRFKFEFPFNQAVMLVMSQVAQKFGNLRGMDTIQNQAATFNVHLANKYKAMAILGLNTYYVLFEGSWVFWSDADLDIDAMTVRQYHKEKVLSAMRLTTQQAPLFVALAGSLKSSEQNKRQLENFFESRNRGLMIQRVVQFVNDQRLSYPVSDTDLTSVISRIFRSCSAELLEDFKKIMQMMDPVENLKVHREVDSSIMELIKDDYANYAEEILENSPIYISPVYLDLRVDGPSLHDLVSVWIQKTAGLLLKHQPEQKQIFRTLLVKPSELARFTEIQVPPIIPEFNVVPLKILVTGRMSEDEKWEILLWLSEIPVTIADLKTIPDEFLVDIIICLHLLKTQAITALEAEGLMRSIVASARSRNSFSIYPRTINARAFNTGFLYMKAFCVLHSCMAAVGLDTFQNQLMFDAAQFQEIYAQSNAGSSTPGVVNLNITFMKLRSISKGDSKPTFTRVPRPSKAKKPTPASDSDSESEMKAINSATAKEETESVDEITEGLQSVKLDSQELQKIESLMEKYQFDECLKEIEVAEKKNVKNPQLVCMKAECLIQLERFDEADEFIDNSKDLKSAGMQYVKGLRNYYDIKLKESIVNFKTALRKNARLEKAEQKQKVASKMLTSINTGCADLKSNKNSEAKEIFSNALPLDTSNKNFSRFVFYNRGVANYKLKLYSDAYQDFSQALQIKESHSKALMRRAQCHFELNEFEDAAIDCEESLKLRPSEEAKKLLDVVKVKARDVVRDPYAILGVQKTATSGEVKKAYYKLSRELHPDKHPDGTAVDKTKLSRKFGHMKDAYDKIMKKFGL